MSSSLFNQNMDLREGPSPFPLPQEREFFSPLLSRHTPPLPRPYPGDRPSFPSPGGEGRVRGLFLGMGEGQNNEVKPAPGKRMDFRRSKCCKWPCIMRSAIYPSPDSPTNSFEEAEFLAVFRPQNTPQRNDAQGPPRRWLSAGVGYPPAVVAAPVALAEVVTGCGNRFSSSRLALVLAIL